MFVHGDNIEQKESNYKGSKDETAKKYLAEIREQYEIWKAANLKLVGPTSKSRKDDIKIISKRVDMLNAYKEFIDQQKYAEKFDSRSNLHSTVLEEFMYYLFKDLIADFSTNVLIGKAHAFKDMFFQSTNFKDMIQNPNLKLEIKDHDFVIGVEINSEMACRGEKKSEKHVFQIPAVAIECKTYLDKTMLEGSSTAGQQLLVRNPNAIYIVVAEWLKLTEKVNLKKFSVDQIFILRKQKNTDREFRYDAGYKKNPIYPDVVENLFNMVRNHLTSDWEGTLKSGLEKGSLI